MSWLMSWSLEYSKWSELIPHHILHANCKALDVDHEELLCFHWLSNMSLHKQSKLCKVARACFPCVMIVLNLAGHF